MACDVLPLVEKGACSRVTLHVCACVDSTSTHGRTRVRLYAHVPNSSADTSAPGKVAVGKGGRQ